MGGMGQVGSCFWVYLRTKNQRLKKTLMGALPVGIFGVGEPLLFGVSLPLGKPFIAGCIGGAAGGALMAYFQVGIIIPFGTAGLSLIPLVGMGRSSNSLSQYWGLGCRFYCQYINRIYRSRKISQKKKRKRIIECQH
ncbi:PTS transporter subunit EIIC [Proteus mirabilis]